MIIYMRTKKFLETVLRADPWNYSHSVVEIK